MAKKENLKAIFEECRKRGVSVDDLLEFLEKVIEKEVEVIPIEKRIAQTLRDLGIPPSIKGYYYIQSSIIYLIEHGENVRIVKELYPAVAKKHGTTVSRVERAIRHAIQVAWDNKDRKLFEEIFGSSTYKKRRWTNGEVLFGLYNYLKPLKP